MAPISNKMKYMHRTSRIHESFQLLLVVALSQVLLSFHSTFVDAEGYGYAFDTNMLSQYSSSFEKCQRVKYYSDEAAQNDGFDGPLAVKQFVLFRLCGNSDWSDTSAGRCSNCNSNYGEYVIEAVDYLDATVQYADQMLEQLCGNCNGYQCPSQCKYYQDGDIGDYLNAADYIECQQVSEFDDGTPVYAGPRCSSDGSSIRIAAFEDQNCWYPMKDVDLKTVLGSSISHHLFQFAAFSSRSCIDCSSDDDDGNVNDTCEYMYSVSGKCETKHGFLDGLLADYEADDQIYENQLANEYEVCTFIDSLMSGSYDQRGEIVHASKQKIVTREITANQSVALTALSLTIAGLSVYIIYLHSYIKVHHSW
eukprot:CAMPEP_0116011432 /NCGR_PEP_ID=MMETSP0321-20121206/4565_1 /TAXON_ID=163516 /ORGANISM="Leptocylindrus danicus var. danicus, Strain B650" /LENGTH=364 /DNA_ID=CAMNT_0003480665 /DNA_START=44 /DNA_END=1135 /DNA_ORIENTATION=-